MARYEVLVGFNHGEEELRADPGDVVEDLEKTLSERTIASLRRQGVIRPLERGEKTADVRRAARARAKESAGTRTALLERLAPGTEIASDAEYVPIGAHRAPVTGPFSRLAPADHPSPEAIEPEVEAPRRRGRGPSSLVAPPPEETPDVVEAPTAGSPEADPALEAVVSEAHAPLEPEPPRPETGASEVAATTDEEA